MADTGSLFLYDGSIQSVNDGRDHGLDRRQQLCIVYKEETHASEDHYHHQARRSHHRPLFGCGSASYLGYATYRQRLFPKSRREPYVTGCPPELRRPSDHHGELQR